MIYDEWRKLEHVKNFIYNLNDDEHTMLMMAKTMKFCYEQGGIYGPVDEKGKYCEFCGPDHKYRCCVCGYEPEKE